MCEFCNITVDKKEHARGAAETADVINYFGSNDAVVKWVFDCYNGNMNYS